MTEKELEFIERTGMAIGGFMNSVPQDCEDCKTTHTPNEKCKELVNEICWK